MSTEDSQNTLPVRWDEELAKQATEVASLERPRLSTIRMRSGILAYEGVALPGNKLPCVIVASAFQHRFYEGSWDPDNPTNPVCFSLSMSGQDMVPHEESEKPQSASCDTCENFKWGSATRDGKPSRGKACKAGRRLIVIPATAIQNGGVAKAEMAMLTLPVTSIRGWANYVNSLSAQFRRPPWAMLTEISVVPDMKTQFQVKFEPIGVVEEQEALAQINAKIQLATQVLMTPYEFSESVEKEAEPEAPKGKKKY